MFLGFWRKAITFLEKKCPCFHTHTQTDDLEVGRVQVFFGKLRKSKHTGTGMFGFPIKCNFSSSFQNQLIITMLLSHTYNLPWDYLDKHFSSCQSSPIPQANLLAVAAYHAFIHTAEQTNYKNIDSSHMKWNQRLHSRSKPNALQPLRSIQFSGREASLK